MSVEPQPAPLKVWHIIRERFPLAHFDGIIRGPGHEDHSEGRALDVGLHARQPEQRRVAEALVGALLRNAREVGWAYFIWNRQIWYNDARGGPLPYTGTNPHTDHIHISWSLEAAQRVQFPGLMRDLDRLTAAPPAP